MAQWSKVSWSSADQVVSLAGNPAGAREAAGIEPAVFFRKLVESDALTDATSFMGHALPRYEAVVWATQALRTRKTKGDAFDDELMTAILQWVDDPSDERRRAIRDLANSGDSGSPAAMLAMAVFFSGGSMSEPDLAPILPPPDACGKFAYAAVLKAAGAEPDRAASLRDALRIGETIASGGAAA